MKREIRGEKRRAQEHDDAAENQGPMEIGQTRKAGDAQSGPRMQDQIDGRESGEVAAARQVGARRPKGDPGGASEGR